MEICPAGPPKLTKPSLSQYRNASKSGIGAGGEGAVGAVGAVRGSGSVS
jgi:hypothetical protein